MNTTAENIKRLTLIAFTVAVSIVPVGCRSSNAVAGDGISLSASLPLRSYVQSAIVGGNGGKVYFPQLQIYNASGSLIYTSHNPVENAQTLKTLPENLQALQPIPKAPGLSGIIETMPDFQGKKDELLNRKRATVLSVFLEECHACSLQEDALDNTQKQLLNHGINLLVVRVARPT